MCDRQISEADWFRTILQHGEVGALKRLASSESENRPSADLIGRSTASSSGSEENPADLRKPQGDSDSAQRSITDAADDPAQPRTLRDATSRGSDRFASWLAISLALLIAAAVGARLFRK